MNHPIVFFDWDDKMKLVSPCFILLFGVPSENNYSGKSIFNLTAITSQYCHKTSYSVSFTLLLPKDVESSS